jgi:hypothetical protein
MVQLSLTVIIRIRVQMFTMTAMSLWTSAHLALGGSSIAANFSDDANSGITRSGEAEASDAEPEESDEPAVLGRGQRRKIATRCYQDPTWMER